MSAWRVDLISNPVHLVRPSSKEGNTIAVLRKQPSVQVRNTNQSPTASFTYAVAPPVPDPFPKPAKKIRQVLRNENFYGLPATTITRFATCAAISLFDLRWGSSFERSVGSSLLCYIMIGILIRMDLSQQFCKSWLILIMVATAWPAPRKVYGLIFFLKINL